VVNGTEGGLRPWTLPNLLTFSRLVALPFLVNAILEGHHLAAAAIFLAASITDIVDGYLARRFGMASPLGAYLDPVADKLVLVSTFIVLTIPSTPTLVHVPVWLLVLLIFRDVLIVVISLVLFLALGMRTFTPSPLGKATTFVEIATVVAILLHNLGWMPAVVAETGFPAVAAFTLGSGIHYIWRLSTGLPRPAPGPSAPG
jgi:cardiolipin synthase